MKVAATCIQLIRDMDHWRERLTNAGLEVVVPTIPGQHLEGDELVDALQGCVGVIAGDDKFTADVIERLPELKVISKWGSGIDGIDLAAAAEHGIPVRNTPGMFDDEVADYTMAMLVMLARHLGQVSNGIHDGGWPKPPGTSLNASTLGVIGLGGIGRAVAKRGIVSSMEVLGSDPSPQSAEAARSLGVEVVEVEDVLRRADFISINCPLVESTRNLINDRTLAITKPGVRIVNTGRGGVVETAALVRALDSGHVAAAALDVLDVEPIPAQHDLIGRPNVVLGSHNASNTLEASARVHEVAINNLIEEFATKDLL